MEIKGVKFKLSIDSVVFDENKELDACKAEFFGSLSDLTQTMTVAMEKKAEKLDSEKKTAQEKETKTED